MTLLFIMIYNITKQTAQNSKYQQLVTKSGIPDDLKNIVRSRETFFLFIKFFRVYTEKNNEKNINIEVK